jgi:CubicO group peptidase (beta-lactamase class C family)
MYVREVLRDLHFVDILNCLMRNTLICLALCAAIHADSATTKQTEVDRFFGAFTMNSAGCAVGVADHGTVALTAGYGMVDLERGVPITAETVFESGSVAKQFTAMSVLLMAQKGKISLDDPLRKYLPELQDYGTPVTILRCCHI